MKKLYLLSYPKSGSNWLTYCIENIFKTNVVGATKEYTVFGHSHNINFIDDLVVCKGHGHMKNEWIEYDGLIFLIRDYKNSVVPFSNFNMSLVLSCLSGVRKNIPDYIHGLKYFDSFNKPKVMIIYEQLIKSPETELNKISTFFSNFNIDTSNIQNFIDNIENHKINSMKKYRPGKRKNNKSCSENQLEKIRTYLKKNFLSIYEKYLLVYDDKNTDR